jgi:hypothetical protein
MKEIPRKKIKVTSSLNEYPLTSWEKGWGWARPNPFLLQASVAKFLDTDWAPNGTRLTARCHFTGPKKVSISRAQPSPTCPRIGYARIKNITYGAAKIKGE